MAAAVTILSPRRMVMRYGLVATNPIELLMSPGAGIQAGTRAVG